MQEKYLQDLHISWKMVFTGYVCYNDPQMPTHNNQTYDYFRGDYVALNDYFCAIDWDLLFDGNSSYQPKLECF